MPAHPTPFPIFREEDRHSSLEFIERNKLHLAAYVRQTYPLTSYEGHLADIRNMPPQVGRSVIESYITPQQMKDEILLRSVLARESEVMMFLGAPGERKTMTAWTFARKLKARAPRRPLVGVGDPGDIPEFATPVDTLEDAPPYAIVVNDEIAVQQGTRTWNNASQRGLHGTFGTARHRKWWLLGVNQNASVGDLSWTIFVDSLFFKPGNLFQEETERGPIAAQLKLWDEMMPRNSSETFVIGRHIRPMRITWPVPSDWKPEWSQSYAIIPTWGEAVARALRLSRRLPPTLVSMRMAQRGWPLPPSEWEEVLEAHNGGVSPWGARKPRKPAKRRRRKESA